MQKVACCNGFQTCNRAPRYIPEYINEVFETIYLSNKNFSVAELLEIPADAENMEWQIELKKRGLFAFLFLPKPKTQNNSVIKQPNNPLKNILT